MEIDVIIPLYKPGKELFTLLDKLGSQSVPVHQVILLNTEEKYFEQLIYGTRFLEQYQNIKVYHVSKREFDHGGTRRMGVKKSSADVFVMMTQDAMPVDNKLIENLIEPLQGSTAVSYARQLPRKDSTPVESYTREFNYPERSRIKSAEDLKTLGIKTFFCSNVCAAWRREKYLELGGFVKHTIFNEDMILAGTMIKQGGKIAYCAKAKVIHSHNYSAFQQFHRNFDLAVSQTMYPEVFGGIRSESEGIKLVKKSLSYCIKIGKPWLMIQVVTQSAGKLLGYKMGQRYRSLPMWLILRCTMSPSFWRGGKA